MSLMMVSSRSPESRIVAAYSLLGRQQRGVEQQPFHADHRVLRHADLVAHRGEERALRLVGGLGRGAPPASRARNRVLDESVAAWSAKVLSSASSLSTNGAGGWRP